MYANLVSDAIGWLFDPANHTGSQGIPNRLVEHLEMTGVSLLFALIPALVAGIAIGHTRRAEFLTITIANLGRAIPSFAILAFVFPFTLRLGLGLSNWPAIIALVFLAIPPILTNSYVGVKEVDPDLLEAARGMGMSTGQLLRQVELPLAAPLIVAGIRTSAVNVVATATLAAIVAGGGLGRFIIDGFALNDHEIVLGGAILVALLAIVTELVLGLVERLVTPHAPQHGQMSAAAYQEAGQAPVAPV